MKVILFIFQVGNFCYNWADKSWTELSWILTGVFRQEFHENETEDQL